MTMKGANFLEKLLDNQPVEWKKLGEVCKVITVSSKLKTSAYKEEGRVPIIDQGAKFIAGYTDAEVVSIEKANM